jgi:hypothetical protein
MVIKRRFLRFGIMSLTAFSLMGCGCHFNTADDCMNACGWGTGICEKCSNGKYNCVTVQKQAKNGGFLNLNAPGCKAKAVTGVPAS